MKRTTKKPAAKASGKSSVPAKTQSTSNREVAAASSLMASQAGAGLENVTAADLLIPRLAIIQALSPQIDKNEALYDPNANVGDIYDVGTGERVGNAMSYIPVHFVKVWLEWAPRRSGNGLVAIHDTPAILQHCEKDEKGRPYHGENLVQETAQFYGLNLNFSGRRSFIPFASTQMKKAKNLLTLAMGERIMAGDREMTPPLFYRAYDLTTIPESNAEGKWIGWKIERGQLTEDIGGEDLVRECMAFRDSLLRGEAKADTRDMQQTEATGASGDAASDNTPM